MAYRLDDLAALAHELGLATKWEDADSLDVVVHEGCVLSFCNLEGDTMMGFEGTPWHHHGVLSLETGDNTYIECDELDVLIGLGSGDLLIVSSIVNGEVRDRWISHREQDLEVRHIASGEELRVFRLPEPNAGLKSMFVMMNHARLWVGLQGLAQAERSRQAALDYARERRQGRAARGSAKPDKPADLIVDHADVRRMLLTQKAFIEASRVLTYFAGMQMDKAKYHPDPAERQRGADLLAILTPVVKAFVTDMAVEVTNLGIQVHGGYGYIRETGVEQFMRDARIACIYEGTNGVQALDLLGRKVLGSGGQLARLLGGLIGAFCQNHAGYEEMADFVPRLAGLLKEWSEATEQVAQRAARDPDEIGAAAADYLQFTGYLCLAWCWAKMAAVAIAALRNSPDDPAFYQAKVATARFFFARLLPRAEAHLDALQSGSASVMALSTGQLG